MLRLDLLPTDSWFGTSPACPGVGNTRRAPVGPSWALEGIHMPMLKTPNPDPSSECLGALAAVRAEIGRVPRKAAVGEMAAARSVHKMGFFLLGSNSFAPSEVWIQVHQPGIHKMLEKGSVSDLRGRGAGSSVCQPWGRVVVKICPPPHTPGKPSVAAGIGTETEKTFASWSKHRELPIGQNQIKHDL